MISTKSNTKFDIAGDWTLNLSCNFRCKYCFQTLGERKDIRNIGGDYRHAVEAFDKTGLKWLITLCGGEPFMYPNFIELSKGLTRKHHIAVVTNLSSPLLYKFINEISPKRVLLFNCSLHYEERHRLNLVEDFCEKLKALRRAGFLAYATEVIWPGSKTPFSRIYAELKEKEVIVQPRVFRGFYKGKYYPMAYTKKEREVILKHMETARDDDQEIKDMLRDPIIAKYTNTLHAVSFMGHKCRAGKDYVTIDYEGKVHRCHVDKSILGNLYQGTFNRATESRVCIVHDAQCPLRCIEYSEGEAKVIEKKPSTFMNRYIYPYTTPLRRRLGI